MSSKFVSGIMILFSKTTEQFMPRGLRRSSAAMMTTPIGHGDHLTCGRRRETMMKKREGTKVWLSHTDDPMRKLKYSWKLAEMPDGALVGVDTGAANRIVGEAVLS